jgi:hypothetical protein
LLHIDSLLLQTQTENCYTALIRQLNTDFARAGIAVHFNETSLPQALKDSLQETLSQLMEKQTHKYRQLLYLIDVPEQQISAIEDSNAAEQAAFLILRREWQKVSLRMRNG